MNLSFNNKGIFLNRKRSLEIERLKQYLEKVRQFKIDQNNKRIFYAINTRWAIRKKQELDMRIKNLLIENNDDTNNKAEADTNANALVINKENNSLALVPSIASTQLINVPSVGIVVAHYNEDLSWLSLVKYKCRVISKFGLRKETPPNKGNEASSYLQYIINNYDALDDYTIFVHGHRTAWHHHQNMDEKINRLQFSRPYYNINDGGLNYLTRIPEWNKMRYMLPPVALIFGKFISLKHVKFRNSAQFYVHKNNILRHPKEIYQKLYDYLMNSRESSYWTGRVFEYLWHIIFTGDIHDVE